MHAQEQEADDMTWVRLDDGFAGHRKLLPRSDAAFRMEVAALCWCNQQGNDGKLTLADVRLLSGYLADPGQAAGAVQELVAAGLWDAVEGGYEYELHDYEKYQPSAHERQASNDAAAERMRKYRERRHQPKAAPDGPIIGVGVTTSTRVTQPVTGSYAVTSREVRSSRPDPGPIPAPLVPKEQDLKSFAGGSSPSPLSQYPLLPEEPKRQAPARQIKRDKPVAPTTATWTAYSNAYARRYGPLPVHNAKIAGQLSQLVAQMGAEESPRIAEFYLSRATTYYVTQHHPIGLLLRDAQGLRTEMLSGRVVNAETARQDERRAAGGFTVIAEALRRREDKHGDVIDVESDSE